MQRRVPGATRRIFTALFDQSAIDALLAQGCVQIQKGCNTCMVRYVNCGPEAQLCADGNCLARHCERKQICTAKFCTVEDEALPGCNTRISQLGCNLTLYETGAGDVPVVGQRRRY